MRPATRCWPSIAPWRSIRARARSSPCTGTCWSAGRGTGCCGCSWRPSSVAPRERRATRMRTTEATRRGVTFGALGPFFALAFGLTWGIVALYILFRDPIEALFGDMAYTHPLFRLAVYSPGLAGVFLIWRHHGVGGLGSYFRRLALWRMPF